MDVERRPAARLAFLFQWMLGSSSVVIKSKPISTEDVELDYSYEVHQRENARQVLRQLALGVDPRSGCAVAQNPLLQDPGVIRALFLAIEALTDHEVPTPPDTREKHLHRAGLPWSEEEDEQLRQQFAQRINIQVITEMHYRTQGAIASRLVHLKLITSREEVRHLLAWS